jgi:Glycosyltransferase family 87
VSAIPTRSRQLAPERGRRAGWSASFGQGAWLGALLGVALAGVVTWWTWRALHDPNGYDFRLAYKGGQVAWATGHPEEQYTWTGTPLLAAVLALLSRLESLRVAGDVLTIVNAMLVVVAVAMVMWRLRDRLSPGWWWVTALALLSFGPIMSTVWWKQFNIIALVLAVAGFELVRRRRPYSAAALIGLSIAIKPLVFLLPVVLLVRRETRRAGALALVWIAALSLAGQAFLAVRAHDLGVLSPSSAVNNFVAKTQPGFHPRWACMKLNFAPDALLCRLAGTGDWTLQHIVVWIAVAVLGVVAFNALRGRREATSWELFAVACPLSAMLSPLAWSHYQILLVPLFVLLLVRFTTEGAGVVAWTALAAAFVLASLMWEPYDTSIAAVTTLLSTHPPSAARRVQDALSVALVAQYAQYALFAAALLWYGRRANMRHVRGRRL